MEHMPHTTHESNDKTSDGANDTNVVELGAYIQRREAQKARGNRNHHPAGRRGQQAAKETLRQLGYTISDDPA